MHRSTQLFINELKAQELKHSISASDDGSQDYVTIIYSGDNMSTIKILYAFSDSCEKVSIRVFDIASNVPSGKIGTTILTVNQLNNRYSFAKFCFAEDESVQLEIDAVIRDHDTAAICMELLRRTVSICDAAYPVLMKSLWE